MTNKIVLGAIIVAAFVAGTMTTGTMVSAAPENGNPLQRITEQLTRIADGIENVGTGELAVLEERVEDVEALLDANAPCSFDSVFEGFLTNDPDSCDLLKDSMICGPTTDLPGVLTTNPATCNVLTP